uniref:CSON006970 protein n=1 Tax=Culicoides sonorensis TaxID=179676 RepID=A0A336MZH3_CULSO
MVALKEFLTTFILITTIRYGSGNCFSCNLNMACISEYQYYECFNGMPDVGKIYRCPQGYVCTLNRQCAIAGSNTPTCKLCNVCNSMKQYTCKSLNTYAPCFGSSVVDWEMSCPYGWVCNPAGTKDKPCMSPVSWSDRPLCLEGDTNMSTTYTTYSTSTPYTTEWYLTCTNGIPNITQIHRCPLGEVCSNYNSRCVNASRYTPSCRLCNTCSSIKLYTCKTINSYAICYGNTIIDWELFCPAGMICNPAGTRENPCMAPVSWENRPLCLAGEENFITTTTTSTEPAPSTTLPPSSAYCERQGGPGLYRNPFDSTCRHYVRCSLVSGILVGVGEVCEEGKLFNPNRSRCESGYTCI